MKFFRYSLLLLISLSTIKKACIRCLARVVASIFLVVLGVPDSTILCLAQTPATQKPEKSSPLKTIVTCQFKDKSIEEILGVLQGKYHLSFAYVNNEIPLEKKVTLQVLNQPLDKALTQLFRNTGVTYQEIGSQILLKKNTALDTKANAAPTKPRAPSDSNSTPTSQKRQKGHWKWSDLFSFTKRKEPKVGMGAALPVPKDSAALAKDSIERAESLKKKRNKAATTRLLQDWQWRVGTNFAGQYTYRLLSGNDPYVQNRNVIENGDFGYALGFSVDYKLQKGFYLHTGMELLKWKEKGNYTLPKEYLPPPPLRPKGYPKDTSISYANNYLFLGIPLMVGYTYGDRWFGGVSTGLEPTLFLGYNTSYPLNNEPVVYPSGYVTNPDVKPPRRPVNKDEPVVGDSSYYYKENLDPRNRQFNSFGLVFLLSAELGYRIDERFSISMSPLFKCFLSSILDKEGMREKPYSFGLGVSFYYCLSDNRK